MSKSGLKIELVPSDDDSHETMLLVTRPIDEYGSHEVLMSEWLLIDDITDIYYEIGNHLFGKSKI